MFPLTSNFKQLVSKTLSPKRWYSSKKATYITSFALESCATLILQYERGTRHILIVVALFGPFWGGADGAP